KFPDDLEVLLNGDNFKGIKGIPNKLRKVPSLLRCNTCFNFGEGDTRSCWLSTNSTERIKRHFSKKHHKEAAALKASSGSLVTPTKPASVQSALTGSTTASAVKGA